MTRIADLTGHEYGFLHVIEQVPPVDPTYKRVSWKCVCRCGTIVLKEARNLRFQKFPNCGCINDFVKSITASKYDSNINVEEVIMKFKDYKKFALIASMVRFTMADKENWLGSIEHFYNDKQFNAVYSFWQTQPTWNTIYNWAKPSIDHKLPVSKGGDSELNNLHFITQFENYAKRDMTWSQWCSFKEITNTCSDYYIENIMGWYNA